ncbi:hypothetical protein GUJ93_ZPchr0005g14862 [Zizania palustris]|uniref:Uncharacterized protein n=1 Tax=Zizania palustris TaxID=103762 RepID=A0A8J5SKG2_ZIZPA|nr:hypothetical protein GUJ93_ZPchr0005g14862 [Zizania palustris]
MVANGAAAAQEGITRRAAKGGGGDDAAPAGDGGAGAVSRDPRKVGCAKRGLRSLAAAVELSVALMTASFYASGSAAAAAAAEAEAEASKVVIARAGSVAAEAVMALAAWMVWAEGGLHSAPATRRDAGALRGAAGGNDGVDASFTGARLARGRVGVVRDHGSRRRGMRARMGSAPSTPSPATSRRPCIAWAVLLAVINYKICKKNLKNSSLSCVLLDVHYI